MVSACVATMMMSQYTIQPFLVILFLNTCEDPHRLHAELCLFSTTPPRARPLMALFVVGAFASTAAAAVIVPCLIRRLPHHRLATLPRATSVSASAAGMGGDASAPILGRYLESVSEAAELLAAGELVAFPTETVYGLGANARNAAALGRIFEVKGRPKTDPLIVHVATAADAEPLLAMQSADSLALLRALAADFWPGPLTIVAPMAPDLPTLLSAGTGSVGVRCPSHARARQLIAEAGVPVAGVHQQRWPRVLSSYTPGMFSLAPPSVHIW